MSDKKQHYSYVVLSAEKVLEMSTAALAFYKKRRLECETQEIAEYVAKKNAERKPISWLKRLFGVKPPPPLDGDAVQKRVNAVLAQSSNWFYMEEPESSIYFIRNKWWDDEIDLCKKLIVAAKLGEPLHINVDDLKVIS
jgi:hypothetical protein